jgi:putative chitinase
MISLEQFIAAFPQAKINNLTKFLTSLNAAMAQFEINTPLRISFFLAQTGHESGNFYYTEELASGKAYEHRTDLGNLKKEALYAAHTRGATTGRFYKGRGLIQITGFNNYKACGKALGIDLVNKPELLADPEYAGLSAGWFWSANGCNEIADSGDFKKCTRRINGGYNGLADRKLKLASVNVVINNV